MTGTATTQREIQELKRRNEVLEEQGNFCNIVIVIFALALDMDDYTIDLQKRALNEIYM